MNPIQNLIKRLNQIAKGLNINIERTALSDEVGQAIFALSEQESSIVSEHVSDNSPITVDVTTIDH